MSNEVVAFSYDSLPPDVARDVRKLAEPIPGHVQRAFDCIWKVGVALAAIKGRLPHGAFGPWLTLSFGWSERTAQRYMNVARAFDGENRQAVSHLPVATIYSLAELPDENRYRALKAISASASGEQEVGRIISAEVRSERQAKKDAAEKAIAEEKARKLAAMEAAKSPERKAKDARNAKSHAKRKALADEQNRLRKEKFEREKAEIEAQAEAIAHDTMAADATLPARIVALLVDCWGLRCSALKAALMEVQRQTEQDAAA